MKKLELEINDNIGVVLDTASESIINDGGGTILITPNITENYWVFRVKLSDKQSVIGFPKFWTIGIGFSVESDWNTNLPYTSDVEQIYNHIKINKRVEGDILIKKSDVIRAIMMIQESAKKYKDAWSKL